MKLMRNYQTYTQPSFLLLSAVLLIFMAPAVRFMAPISPGLMRWVLVLACSSCALMFFRKSFARFYQTRVGGGMLVFSIWCLVTVIWSEYSQLTLTKAIGQFLVLLGVTVVSYEWASKAKIKLILDPLFAAMAMVMAAGILGHGQAQATIGQVSLYRGLTTNPNVFGTMLAIVACLIIWRVYQSFFTRKERVMTYAWLLAFLAVLYFLYQAGSRAAIGMFVITLFTVLLVQSLSRRIKLISIVFIILFLVLFAYPSVYIEVVDRLVYKTTDELAMSSNRDILYTREEPWEESYKAAIAGGILGVGYGVHYGAERTLSESAITSVGYGREKGNSQMAVIEEVGWVGLSIYFLALIAWFKAMLRSLKYARNQHEKTLIGIIVGGVLGVNFQSVFEQWWVSPGSQEYAFLAAFLAMGMAVQKRMTIRKKYFTNATELPAIGSKVTLTRYVGSDYSP